MTDQPTLPATEEVIDGLKLALDLIEGTPVGSLGGEGQGRYADRLDKGIKAIQSLKAMLNSLSRPYGEEMVEKVARAICEAERVGSQKPDDLMVKRIADVLWPLSDWNGDYVEAENAARAVLASLSPVSVEKGNGCGTVRKMRDRGALAPRSNLSIKTRFGA